MDHLTKDWHGPVLVNDSGYGVSFHTSQYRHHSDDNGWVSFETQCRLYGVVVGYVRWSYKPCTSGRSGYFWRHACVTFSRVHDRLRGHRFGYATYIAASKAVAQIAGLMLVGDDDAMQQEGAKRVWRSLATHPRFRLYGVDPHGQPRKALDYR